MVSSTHSPSGAALRSLTATRRFVTALPLGV